MKYQGISIIMANVQLKVQNLDPSLPYLWVTLPTRISLHWDELPEETRALSHIH